MVEICQQWSIVVVYTINQLVMLAIEARINQLHLRWSPCTLNSLAMVDALQWLIMVNKDQLRLISNREPQQLQELRAPHGLSQ